MLDDDLDFPESGHFGGYRGHHKRIGGRVGSGLTRVERSFPLSHSSSLQYRI